MITLYGIPNCDTVKRARQALQQAGIEHQFHNFKSDGLPEALAQQWIDTLGLDTVINRAGTTWRKLDASTRSALSAATAAALLSREPSLVKRPVIDAGGTLSVGFARKDEADILARLSAAV